MLDGGTMDKAKIEEALAAFDEAVLPFLFAAASQKQFDSARAMLAGLQEKLTRFEAVLPRSAGTPATSAGMGRDGLAHRGESEPGSAELDALGRNQRAKLRELMLLEILANVGEPCPIQTVMGRLAGQGFDDGQPAVVSHLHRLKSDDLIEQPGPSMYMITAKGRDELHKLKRAYGHMLRR